MSKFLIQVAGTFIGIFIGLGVVKLMGHVIGNPTPKYNCSMASFHPDIPTDVKRKCREVQA